MHFESSIGTLHLALGTDFLVLPLIDQRPTLCVVGCWRAPCTPLCVYTNKLPAPINFSFKCTIVRAHGLTEPFFGNWNSATGPPRLCYPGDPRCQPKNSRTIVANSILAWVLLSYTDYSTAHPAGNQYEAGVYVVANWDKVTGNTREPIGWKG